MLGGDVNLSVTMTTVSTISALGTLLYYRHIFSKSFVLINDESLIIDMNTIHSNTLGMMPMWMYFLGSKIIDGEDIEIPFARIIIALIL